MPRPTRSSPVRQRLLSLLPVSWPSHNPPDEFTGQAADLGIQFQPRVDNSRMVAYSETVRKSYGSCLAIQSVAVQGRVPSFGALPVKTFPGNPYGKVYIRL